MNECYDLDLIINSLGRGGAERVCVTLANEFANRGLKIRIIVLRNVNINYENDVSEKVHILHLNSPKDVIGLLKLKKILKMNKFKKILAFDERITSICNYIKIKQKEKFIIISRVVNNVDFQEKENKKVLYKFLYSFSKKYFKYSDIYIFQCKNMMVRMKKYFNLDDAKSKMNYIYNPLSEKFYNVKTCSKKDDYFLMVGRIEKQKGYEYAINALIECKKKGKSINLKILGDGTLKNSINELIVSNKLNVEFLGNVYNVQDYYRRAKGLLLTSIYEGFPNVLLEAIACGCPIISFDCPTGPSEIINQDNGILIDYLNVKKLSNTLLNFDNIKWNYNKIIDSSNKFNKKSIIEEYIRIIEGD